MWSLMRGNKIELISCESGDWEVLKLNGEVYDEGHNIPAHVWLRLLSRLGNKISTNTICDEDMETGNY